MAGGSLAYTADIPVRDSIDVFVAGGGPAGLAAAVTAARQGARTYLAESGCCFGGMGTAALVPLFCYFTDQVDFLAGGFGREVFDRMCEAGGAAAPDPRNPHGAVPFHGETLKRLYDAMAEEAGVAFMFGTRVVDVVQRGASVTHVICHAASGFFAVEARMVVDGTGNGDVAVMAGAQYEKGDESGAMQPGTLCSLWADVDWDAVRASRLDAEKELPRAFGQGVFTVEDLHLPGMFRTGRHLAGGNIGHAFGLDGTDEHSLTRALVHGRRLVLEYERYYKEYLSGYENMELAATGAMGVRETRRIVGDYRLTVEAYRDHTRFDDDIGCFAYPVDVHAATPDAASHQAFEEEFRKTYRAVPGTHYGIPYRCLLPVGLDNVLVSGRCISTDRGINGSLRVMPGCFITGQAAGMAAALCAAGSLTARELDIPALQQRLRDIGAYL